MSGLTKVSKIFLEKKEIAQNSKLETHFWNKIAPNLYFASAASGVKRYFHPLCVKAKAIHTNILLPLPVYVHTLFVFFSYTMDKSSVWNDRIILYGKAHYFWLFQNALLMLLLTDIKIYSLYNGLLYLTTICLSCTGKDYPLC